MGNRAVITTAPYKPSNLGIYVHWNGGQESVEAFLAACRQLGYQSPDNDCYGWAGLVFVIGLFFEYDGLSIGVDQCKNLDTDNGDNGTWLIKDWQIVGNKFGDAPTELSPPQREKRDAMHNIIVTRASRMRTLKEAV